MRIALANWTNRLAGGVETYLGTVAAGLAAAGHEVGVFHETEAPRDRVTFAGGIASWSLATQGTAAVDALLAWRPDVLYLHAVHDAALERRLVEALPTVFFIHQYHGTCISGTKTHAFPVVHPCSRRFGPACLALFLPRRCGGRSPLTMLDDYQRQAYRLETLRHCRLLVTHSAHMQAEYVKHGFDAARVRRVPFAIRPAAAGARAPERRHPGDAARLLFVARLERLKGGGVLLAALPEVAARLGRGIELTIVGDGREKAAWRAQAAQSGASVRFAGWLAAPELDALYAASDLVAVPSLWPEPFGMVGLEAGRFGIPSAGFATGGIPEWLHDGENGCLAPANPPTAAGLAQAIVRCLADPGDYQRLRAGARAAAAHHTVERHLPALLDVLSAARAA